jgi:hypothetical protein
MSSDTCQYARTRESLADDSPNKNKNWCDEMAAINGDDHDMHGAHIMITNGFDSVHISHIELFNAGQARLARYPMHWHFSGYVGKEGGNEEDPSLGEN